MARNDRAPIRTKTTERRRLSSASPRIERAREVWRGARRATLVIRREIDEEERRDAYQEPLREALAEAGLGVVLGAGQMFHDAEGVDEGVSDDANTSGPAPRADRGRDMDGLEHAMHVIDLRLDDLAAALPRILDVIARARAAHGVDDHVSLDVVQPDGTSETWPLSPRC